MGRKECTAAIIFYLMGLVQWQQFLSRRCDECGCVRRRSGGSTACCPLHLLKCRWQADLLTSAESKVFKSLEGGSLCWRILLGNKSCWTSIQNPCHGATEYAYLVPWTFSSLCGSFWKGDGSVTLWRAVDRQFCLPSRPMPVLNQYALPWETLKSPLEASSILRSLL